MTDSLEIEIIPTRTEKILPDDPAAIPPGREGAIVGQLPHSPRRHSIPPVV